MQDSTILKGKKKKKEKKKSFRLYEGLMQNISKTLQFYRLASTRNTRIAKFL